MIRCPRKAHFLAMLRARKARHGGEHRTYTPEEKALIVHVARACEAEATPSHKKRRRAVPWTVPHYFSTFPAKRSAIGLLEQAMTTKRSQMSVVVTTDLWRHWTRGCV